MAPIPPSFDMFSPLQSNEVGVSVGISAEMGVSVGISAEQAPHTSYDTPAWYTQSMQSMQSCYPTSAGTMPLEFDFSGLMDFDTELTNHNGAFDFTFPLSTLTAPTIVAPSPTVTPTNVMATPQALPTTTTTNEQPSTTKKTKKRKTLEDESAHCILPEGSRRQRKPRRLPD